MSRRALLVVAVLAVSACTKRDPPAPAPSLPSSSSPAPAAAQTAQPAPGQPTQPAQPGKPVAKSSGCGKEAASPRGLVREIDRRTFNTWGPSSYDPNRPYPVVLTFHGIGTNGRDFQKWFKMEEHVEGAAFTVYPDAERIWDLRGDSDLKFTGQIIEALASAFCIDRSRVFALGFSYGAKLVHHLGCKRPGLVRAISGGDGSWPRETDCSPVPVLVTHRTRDDDEQLAWGKDSAARWAKINGCTDETDTTDAAHGCVAYRGCKAPNTVTFCEDRFFDPKWPHDWNHTIREEYRALTWAWFKSF